MIEITIPVLDEESSLDENIRKVLAFTAGPFPDLQLVIADNGSTDKTPEIAAALQAEFPGKVRHLRLEERGVGRALKASWGGSTADIVGYFDLDLATDLKHLSDALPLLQTSEADIVTGSRLTRGAKVIGRSVVRATTSRVFNAIVKVMFNNRFSDGMCGFKFLKRSHFDTLSAAGATSDGWIYATEILIVGEKLGLNVLEIPVVWTDDPDSKAKIGKLANEYIRSLRELRSTLKAANLM